MDGDAFAERETGDAKVAARRRYRRPLGPRHAHADLAALRSQQGDGRGKSPRRGKTSKGRRDVLSEKSLSARPIGSDQKKIAGTGEPIPAIAKKTSDQADSTCVRRRLRATSVTPTS